MRRQGYSTVVQIRSAPLWPNENVPACQRSHPQHTDQIEENGTFMNNAQFDAHQRRPVLDCQVCLEQHLQHYAAVTKNLIKAGTMAGTGAGVLLANHNIPFRHTVRPADSFRIVGVSTVIGALLGWVWGEWLGKLYCDVDLFCVALFSRKCTCLPAQPS